MDDVPVTVVIATYQEGAALAATVQSVLAADPRPAQLLIVDDGSTDGSTLVDWPAAVRVLRREHHGIAAARNTGALAATQPVLVFLDAHCEVDGAWLPPLLRAIDRHPDAIAGPSMHDARDPRHVGCGARLVDPLFTYRWSKAEGDAVHAVGIVPGGCLAVRRERFLVEGCFGPLREFGLEDVDLSLRWWRAGHPVLGVPAAHVTHQFRATPPYRPDRQAWLENVLTTALRHLSGHRLAVTVRCCAGRASFPAAIAAAFERLPPGAPIADAALEDYLREWAHGAWP